MPLDTPSQWALYLSVGVHNKIYHMCQRRQLQELLATGTYYPPTYQQDGFVHCTSDPHLLLGIANAFYKSSPVPQPADADADAEHGDDWLVVSLMTHLIGEGGKTVRFEAPAPVGGVTREEDKQSAAAAGPPVLFPHVYGPLTAGAVVRSYPMRRAADGSFLCIEGITGRE